MTTFFFRPRATSVEDDALYNFVPRVLSGIGGDEDAVLNADARLPRCSHHLVTNTLFIVVVASRLPLSENAFSKVFVVKVDDIVSRLVFDRKSRAPLFILVVLLPSMFSFDVFVSFFRRDVRARRCRRPHQNVVSKRPIGDRCHMH